MILTSFIHDTLSFIKERPRVSLGSLRILSHVKYQISQIQTVMLDINVLMMVIVITLSVSLQQEAGICSVK